MKKIVFHMAHPAHFHLFKNVIRNLSQKDFDILVTYNEKDILEDLLKKSELKVRIHKINAIRNVNSGLRLKLQFIQKNLGLFFKLLFFRPDLVLGTSVIISLVGRILKYDSVIVNEDDFDIVQKTVDLGYPYATKILCPSVCRTGIYDAKCIKYEGYHELAYLHPDHFTPDREVVSKYFSPDEPYVILRFAKLKAHHDDGIRGIDYEIARQLVSIITQKARLFITSEREIEPEFEPYRIHINPLDIHHVMAFATLYIGDSQTMAAEAGVLGTPFVRFNDFVGRISYLAELEDEYELGYGIRTDKPDKLVERVSILLAQDNLKELFKSKRARMLKEKINVADFFSHFIENYPKS